MSHQRSLSLYGKIFNLMICLQCTPFCWKVSWTMMRQMLYIISFFFPSVLEGLPHVCIDKESKTALRILNSRGRIINYLYLYLQCRWSPCIHYTQITLPLQESGREWEEGEDICWHESYYCCYCYQFIIMLCLDGLKHMVEEEASVEGLKQ